MRSLSPAGRLIVAGDSEQLAPILSAQYPQPHERCLFGSMLDCLMYSRKSGAENAPSRALKVSGSLDDIMSSQGTVVQLTENFRLNPDLGEFVSTIYSRQLKSQKLQARQLAFALKQAETMAIKDSWISKHISEAVRRFLTSLSDVMLHKPQTFLKSPQLQFTPEYAIDPAAHKPISLALIRLKTWSSLSNHVAYEMHVHGEAAVAASLVEVIRRCSPNDDIFVATPHRIQREAVKNALQLSRKLDPTSEEEGFGNLRLGSHSIGGQVTVDTIERLQGGLLFHGEWGGDL
ncbi:hypothetical protein P691DRAFT_733110 [Macrolepiota fuliginosa MF-IS2]|uniref:DNA2/NAM7 helicase-like C-terminal domain-containing protein n=1 Tax=Macrolepiota fuliginosa MF-IS2 TaxID=1400762 RepID=A0A9P5XBF0_9AGAR|nr:hypothetical protein P691DRAFT_733110 [Macrolepiota fuliginosa MF-IS2]